MAKKEHKIDLNHYIRVYENFLPLDKLQIMLKYFNSDLTKDLWQSGRVGDTGDGGRLDKNVRVVDCIGLTNVSNSLTCVHFGWWLQKQILNHVRQYVKDTGAEVGDMQFSDIEVLRYKASEGGVYKPHVDSSLLYPRRLSIIILLNNEYEGGQLEFPGVGKIAKTANTGIIWPSAFMYPHGVNPVTKGTRYSIVGWIN